MLYRQLLYAIIAVTIVLVLGIERTNFLAPLDEPLEAVLFLLAFFALTLLYANERKTRLQAAS